MTVSDYEKLAETLEALAAKATPGPWQSKMQAVYDQYEQETWQREYVFHAPNEYSDMPCAFPLGGTKEDANAALIVALVNAVPTITAALRECAKMREALLPFAALDDGDMGENNEARRWPAIKVGWIRAAKAIIAKASTDV